MSKFERFTCPLCATWNCDMCGHKIYYADEDFKHYRCPECGVAVGTFMPIRHTSYSKAMDHLEEYRQEVQAKKDWEAHHGTKFESAPGYTAEDFAKAEWCLHPHGGFGHRFGSDLNLPWAVAKNSTITWYSDEKLAERCDFEPVSTSVKVDSDRLQEIIKNRKYLDSDDCYMDVVSDLGVEIVNKKVEIPTEPGIRFSARHKDDLTEYSFITFKEAGSIFVISVDREYKAGLVWNTSVFDKAFVVTNVWGGDDLT